jgi:hypothetical protein
MFLHLAKIISEAFETITKVRTLAIQKVMSGKFVKVGVPFGQN